MVEPVHGSGPIPPDRSADAAIALKDHLHTLSDLFFNVSANGNLSDDDHFCHQVAASISNAMNCSKKVLDSNEPTNRDIAENTYTIMTQTITTELGKTSLEKAAKEYNEGRRELMHQVISTFALHPSATETLSRELHLIAKS